ncbi:hypothetical protein AbraIFM66950_004975 [Aspergillus brasiliensis]|nr:hypothetical protein AbraIFM66950_004975 [Aspergillus brasiliensis]
MPSERDNRKPPIVLLKTKSTPHDNYEEYFHHQTSYNPTFIPVLSHNFHTENLHSIRGSFASGALLPPSSTKDQEPEQQNHARKYGGLIFTSQRAVEGFGKVLAELDDDSEAKNTLKTSSRDLQIYTVGPATHRSLTNIVTTYLPYASIHGADTGNGEALAKFILQHYSSLHTTSSGNVSAKPPLLFLVGEQRRDIIPRTLTSPDLSPEQRIGVDEVVVYETGVMEGFEEGFRGVVEREREIMKGDAGRVVWVVVFSPTGCEGMLRGLGFLDGPNKDKGEDGGRRRFFVATIGPTTRDYLRKEFGFEADVCAERPSPEGVGEGIERFMRESGLS